MDNQLYPNNQQSQQDSQPQYQPPQAPNYPQPPMYPQTPGHQPGHSLAVGALVCGIVSLVLSWMGGLLGIAAGIVGIILSIKAKKQGFVGGMNTAGLVLSIIGLAIGGIMFFACTIPTACTACALVPYM